MHPVLLLLALCSRSPNAPAASELVWGDFDGDGDQLLFAATRNGRLRSLRNPDALFEDSSATSGLASALGVERAPWLDIDSDGALDVHLHARDGDLLDRNLSAGAFEQVELELDVLAEEGAAFA